MFATVLPLIALLCLFVSFVVEAHPQHDAMDPIYEQQAVILQYHHVSDETPPSTSISPNVFIEHLELIKEMGFQVLPLNEVIDGIQAGKGFTQKTLAITFDDGYDSIFATAYPELKKRNYPFTIFINPTAIDQNHGTSMTWQQLEEMQKNGAIIANHTLEHLHLLNRQEQESEPDWLQRIKIDVQTAQARLVEKLNVHHKYLAYPYGEFDENLTRLFKELGYIAFSQQSGPINITSNFQALPRFPASGVYANPETLKVKISSLAFNIKHAEPSQQLRYVNDLAPELLLKVSAHDVIYQQVQCYYQGSAIETNSTIENDQLIISTKLESNLRLGRTRYNCTAPSKSTGNYYWYSMPFITTDEKQTWVD